MSELFAVDVGRNFIDVVAAHVEKRLEGENFLTVLFPNRRAVRFFENRLKAPSLLNVTVAALEDYTIERVYALAEDPPKLQLDIDRYFMLYDILKEHFSLYHRLGGTLEHVFPWCINLSNLFDEFDQYMVSSVPPLQYIEDVVPEAQEILLSLGALYKDYRQAMETENLTYHGDLFRRLETLKKRLTGSFVLAGFSLLTKAQRSIFKYLFQNHNTTVFFHTDLKKRHPVTDPYRLYASWMDGTYWGVKPVEIEDVISRNPPPNRAFYESFDTHAEARQLSASMAGILEKTGGIQTPLDVGVVLPDSQSLFPVLYALDGLEVSEAVKIPKNVTLGFPFERSLFFRLLDALIELSLTRDEKRGFYHAPLNRFLSHPFVQYMRIEKKLFQETAQKLQTAIITHNLSFIRFNKTLKGLMEISEEDYHLCTWLNKNILIPFVSAKTLDEAGKILARIIHAIQPTLSKPGKDFERQMAQNVLDRVLPELSLSQSSHRSIDSPRILCRILKHLVHPLQIPFEGNPLQGIQVMGMLESRLLNFAHLFVLDVNEGILPRSIKIDPLFPPSLNPLVGLPSLETRESLFQYTFFRLVDGAGEAHIFYQKGVTGEEKRVRSRFVEQLLLEEEIRQAEAASEIRELETALVKTASFDIPTLSPLPSQRPSFYTEKLETRLLENISPTLLDEYLTCPHRFYLNRILGIAEETTIEEGQSAPEVGRMVHRILYEAFFEIVNQSLTLDTLKEMRRTALKKISLYVHQDFPTLSPLRRDLLIQLAKFRLNDFFSYSEEEAKRYHTIRVKFVEKPLRSYLKGYHLFGKVDRVDEIQETPDTPPHWRIIDYKTGSTAKIPSPKIATFLESFDLSDYSLAALSRLRSVLHSIQLPMYLYLLKEAIPSQEVGSIEAYLIMLGKPREGIVSKPFHESTLTQSQIASLILYLIEHTRNSPTIAPVDQSACLFCPYLKICQYTTRGRGTEE